jgi:hypothetical protein
MEHLPARHPYTPPLHVHPYTPCLNDIRSNAIAPQILNENCVVPRVDRNRRPYASTGSVHSRVLFAHRRQVLISSLNLGSLSRGGALSLARPGPWAACHLSSAPRAPPRRARPADSSPGPPRAEGSVLPIQRPARPTPAGSTCPLHTNIAGQMRAEQTVKFWPKRTANHQISRSES